MNLVYKDEKFIHLWTALRFYRTVYIIHIEFLKIHLKLV